MTSKLSQLISEEYNLPTDREYGLVIVRDAGSEPSYTERWANLSPEEMQEEIIAWGERQNKAWADLAASIKKEVK